MDGAEAVGLQRLEPKHETSLISNSSSRKTTLVPLFGENFCHLSKKKSHFYVGVNGSPFANLLWWAYTIAHMYQLVLINTSAIRLILKSICIATVSPERRAGCPDE